jgi:hypothetical protein
MKATRQVMTTWSSLSCRQACRSACGSYHHHHAWEKITAGNTGKDRKSNKPCTSNILAYLLCLGLPLQALLPLLLLPLHIPDSGDPPRQKAHPLPIGGLNPAISAPPAGWTLPCWESADINQKVSQQAITGSGAGIWAPRLHVPAVCKHTTRFLRTPEGSLFSPAPLPSRTEQCTGREGARNLESGHPGTAPHLRFRKPPDRKRTRCRKGLLRPSSSITANGGRWNLRLWVSQTTRIWDLCKPCETMSAPCECLLMLVFNTHDTPRRPKAARLYTMSSRSRCEKGAAKCPVRQHQSTVRGQRHYTCGVSSLLRWPLLPGEQPWWPAACVSG